jgi:2-oxoglutarate dehydrogenase E2 component (dihydrolipoamide succinyltransferase)
MTEDVEVTLPKLGESILNATVVQWFKQVGDKVKKDEPLLEVSTDKVNSEIPSPVSGTLKEIYAPAQQELNVGDLLALIETSSSQTTRETLALSPTASSSQESSADMQGYYSPAILRLASEKGLEFAELKTIPGTGSGGRLTKKDLEDFLATKQKPSHLCRGLAPSPTETERVKMSAMRKAIADNMVRSFYGAPHASLICEVDVTEPLKLIAKERDALLESHGVKLTISSFVARAIAKALQEFPFLNSSLEGDTIVVKKYVNLGIAVSVEQGILVPVIRHCQSMRLLDIAKALATLAQKARQGTLTPDEVQEGTITLTNFGMSGIQIGIPIIRYPEVAIIGVGATEKKVVPLENDVLAVRSMMHLCLTFDHRVLDGMYGCGFLSSVKKHLEQDLKIE